MLQDFLNVKIILKVLNCLFVLVKQELFEYCPNFLPVQACF